MAARERGTATSASRIVRLDQRCQRLPRQDLMHFDQEALPRVCLRLPAYSASAKKTASSKEDSESWCYFTGSGGLYRSSLEDISIIHTLRIVYFNPLADYSVKTIFINNSFSRRLSNFSDFILFQRKRIKHSFCKLLGVASRH